MNEAAEATNVARLHELLDYVRQGRIIDAMRDFYAEDTVMQENLSEPTRGRGANIVREQAFVDSVAEWTGFEVTALAGDGDVTFYESTLSFVPKGGAPVSITQVAVQRWRDGRIVHERFYHN